MTHPTSPLEAPIDGELREAVARIVEPTAFKSWQATYDYGLKIGDSEAEARETAEWAHGKFRAEALAKADAILSLLQARQANGAGSAEGWKLVPVEPTDAMLKAAFVAMNETPSGTWKRMKEEGVTPRRLFDVKMVPRYRAMIAATPASAGEEP